MGKVSSLRNLGVSRKKDSRCIRWDVVSALESQSQDVDPGEESMCGTILVFLVLARNIYISPNTKPDNTELL